MDINNFHRLITQLRYVPLKSLIESHPALSVELIKQNTALSIFHEYLTNEIKPNIDILKAYIDLNYNPEFEYTMQLKYQALTTEPTAIEKTMTEAQLLQTNNPLWSLNYTVNQIGDIYDSYNELSKSKYNDLKETHGDFVDYLFENAKKPSGHKLAVRYRLHAINQEWNRVIKNKI